MRKIYIFIPMMIFLSGCFSGGPSSTEIKEAYSKAHIEGLKFLRLNGPYVSSIEWHECKELPDDLAWHCSYNVVFDNNEKKDKTGRFTKTSSGWVYKGR